MYVLKYNVHMPTCILAYVTLQCRSSKLETTTTNAVIGWLKIFIFTSKLFNSKGSWYFSS